MLTEVSGNLVDMAQRGSFDVVVHGCNCFTTMGAGIAEQLCSVWPQVHAADVAFGHPGSPLKLGYYSEAQVQVPAHADAFGDYKSLTIINAYTQFDYGRVLGARYVEYCAVTNVLNRLAARLRSLHASPIIGMPRIGCGLAGGSWEHIATIVNTTLPEFDVRVVDLPTRRT